MLITLHKYNCYDPITILVTNKCFTIGNINGYYCSDRMYSTILIALPQVRQAVSGAVSALSC